MRNSFRAQATIESSRGSTARVLRGQATMEYLVTYGWALLALFAVVAILISTGAFSSSNFSQRECTFQPDLPCSPFILYLDGGTATLRYSLSNGLGFPIKIARITYRTTDMGFPGVKDDWLDEFDSPVFNSGDTIDLAYAFPGEKQPAARDFKTIIATMEYYNCRGVEGDCGEETATKYTTSGRISTVVEPGT